MDNIVFKSRVAEAVHRAVCRFSESDGLGQCQLYSVAGASLLTRLTNRLFVPQAGSMSVFAEEPDGWVEADPAEWGDPEIALSVGEFHCWIADVTDAQPGVGRASTVIDFSSRHFRSLAERHVGHGLIWNRPDPPAFVWLSDGIMPDWLRLSPDEGMTTLIIERYFNNLEFFRPLVRQAVIEYDRLLGRSETRAPKKDQRKARKAERQRRKKSRRCR